MAQKQFKVRKGYVVHFSKGQIYREGNVFLREEADLASQKWKVEEVPCELDVITNEQDETEKVKNTDKGLTKPNTNKMIVRSKK